MSSKLKIKSQQIMSISNKFIKVIPGHKGALHDSLLKLRNDLSNVVIKVSIMKINLLKFQFIIKLKKKNLLPIYIYI